MLDVFTVDDIRRTCPQDCGVEEWRLRLELAACYRVFDRRGWAEEIFNHITVRLSGDERHYLINPFGLHYGEVTARNLVKVDLAGNAVGRAEHPVNRAGFVIHSAIHRVRDDAHCIMHTHHSAGVAVACKVEGLAMDNFYAALLHGRVAYHDFEGVTVDEAEQARLVEHLGDKTCLLLRNHGLLVAERDIASAFYWLYVLQRACEIQVLSASIPGPNLPLTAQALAMSSSSVQDTDPQRDLFTKVFQAAVRRAGVTLEQIA
jgi:ribulose-5-phosphate 4-epimerase/fuculose-1-phosphate aldolase